MVATLGATQGKNGSATLEVTLINCDDQLFWLKIVVNGEMQSNHSDMLQSPTLVVRERKDNKLDIDYRLINLHSEIPIIFGFTSDYLLRKRSHHNGMRVMIYLGANKDICISYLQDNCLVH